MGSENKRSTRDRDALPALAERAEKRGLRSHRPQEMLGDGIEKRNTNQLGNTAPHRGPPSKPGNTGEGRAFLSRRFLTRCKNTSDKAPNIILYIRLIYIRCSLQNPCICFKDLCPKHVLIVRSEHGASSRLFQLFVCRYHTFSAAGFPRTAGAERPAPPTISHPSSTWPRQKTHRHLPRPPRLCLRPTTASDASPAPH